MNVQVIQGRFAEVPTADARGMDRRAFGEFIGGPHLTAQQARAHEDLPFMWWVADNALATDRRAWWLLHWLLQTNCIQTAEVFDMREPVLLVGHDEDDGIWQLIGTSDAGPDGKLGHLSHAIDEDPTLIDVLDLPRGQSAVRSAVGGPWTRQLGYPD
ncbi:hypothetical protein GCM10009745_16420 [Kribbella yunnanensis]|uniref:DUF4913 domain-containing protein n=1 Tax=Kribbella yunnanensis TaxID=190194 RepID=A0ABN2GNP0_9ACTN